MVIDDTPALAYYYIWFNQDSWDRAKVDFPSLGRYSSDDREVMRQHIRWAKSVGIDGFIVSWKNTEVLTARLRTLAEVSNEEGFKLSIIYEALDGERNPLPTTQIAGDLDLFIEELGGNQAFDLFGKPLVIWFGTWEFSREDIASVTDDRRGQLIILASDRNPDDYRDHAGLFDGNAYYWSSVDPNTHEGYEEKLTAMGIAAHEQGGLWIAPAAPGFDDRLLGGERAVSRENGEMLRTQLEAANQSDPDAIGIISWNEFSENSHVEPSCLYGMQALEVLASMLGGDAPSPVPCGAGTDATSGMESISTASAGSTPQFNPDRAESTIAVVVDTNLLPWESELSVGASDTSRAPGAPRLRPATVVLLVVTGGFVVGCFMVIMNRAKTLRQDDQEARS